VNYEEFRFRYWRHIQICAECGLNFTRTKEPCFHGCCPGGRISYWTISRFCPVALGFLKGIEALI
jgi:hypothetical protein